MMTMIFVLVTVSAIINVHHPLATLIYIHRTHVNTTETDWRGDDQS